MASKKTKGKAPRKIARKKVARSSGVRRKTGAGAKKPRRSPPAASASKPAAGAADTTAAMNLLRAWSPSRYSSR